MMKEVCGFYVSYDYCVNMAIAEQGIGKHTKRPPAEVFYNIFDQKNSMYCRSQDLSH